MPTVLSTLYPPLIDTFMPAFPYTGPASVTFSVSPYNSWREIKYMHITLVNQKTNQNAFMATLSTEDLPDSTYLINGIWIVPFLDAPEDIFTLNTETNSYTLNIPASLLKNQRKNAVSGEETGSSQKVFTCDYYYKVQIRFDCYPVGTKENDDPGSDMNYLTRNRAYFSEWSSVCLLKAIPNIKLHLNNFTLESTADYMERGLSILSVLTGDTDPVRVPQYTRGIIPFSGNLTFDTMSSNNNASVASTSGSEYLQSYQIQVRDQTENIIKDSGKIYVTEKDKMNSFYWLCDMTDANEDQTYTVTLTFVTNNQYTFSKDFQFKIIDSSSIVFDVDWDFNKRTLPQNGIEKAILVTSEDGIVTITVKNKNDLSPGYLFIKRASSLDEYKKWELIDCIFIKDADHFSHTFVDRTLGSLVRYKYSCQYLTEKGSWTRTVFSEEIVYPDFYDILISRGDKQLAIRYNEQIASMTPVVNRIKIDTLGGKYPKFAENAKLNYKQFNLTGLILAESDYNRKFLDDLDYSSQMKDYDDNIGGAYSIRNDTVEEEFSDEKVNGTYTADIVDASTYINKRKRDTQKNTYHDLYPMDNWWWERKFREEAIKWLNDGEPKLYRSMTEGNMIVMFNDITLTPNTQLGRRVWNFSATVYEVGDGYSLDQLDSLGIFPVKNDYAVNFSSDTSSDESSEPTTTGTIRRRLGQQYRVKGDASSNGKKIVIDGLIQDELSWLYSGLYGNYNVIPNSIRLYDVKIQFESLPQWYDLDTLNSESPKAPVLTITDNEGLSKTVQWNESTKSWEEVTTGKGFGSREITQWISDWEQTKIVDEDNPGEGGNQLVKVEIIDDDDNILTSISGNTTELTEELTQYMDNTAEELSKQNYGLGYKLRIDFASPYSATTSTSLLTRTIFVNKLGYYQIPSNLIVKQITLYDGAVATIDYILEYNLDYNDETEPDSYEVVNTIVGQVSGKWTPGTNISPIIKSKYAAYDKANYITTQQMLDSWKAMSFDLTPYSILDLRFLGDSYSTQRIVGRTGVLNLETDYPIDTCVIQGKRMVEAPISRQLYLDDWEYVLDDSVNGEDSPGDDVSEEAHWWIMHTDSNFQNESDILVKIELGEPYDDSIARLLMEEWKNSKDSSFTEKHEVKNPSPNTVYGVVNDMGFFEYKLYYQDHAWYDIVFPNIAQGDTSIAYAKVPVYGMIGYKANIMKKLWVQ